MSEQPDYADIANKAFDLAANKAKEKIDAFIQKTGRYDLMPLADSLYDSIRHLKTFKSKEKVFLWV
ncbi:MAG: hypothetical protein EB127_23455 [Alphaproteobacteria bacterium]|nr:hypothetical protein [Alphaproteobacteria bacterium]